MKKLHRLASKFAAIVPQQQRIFHLLDAPWLLRARRLSHDCPCLCTRRQGAGVWEREPYLAQALPCLDEAIKAHMQTWGWLSIMQALGFI
jgi:hypothetical protein